MLLLICMYAATGQGNRPSAQPQASSYLPRCRSYLPSVVTAGAASMHAQHVLKQHPAADRYLPRYPTLSDVQNVLFRFSTGMASIRVMQ